MFGAGDAVFHPRHGSVAVSGLTRRDTRHPTQEVASGDVSAQEEYYDIQLMGGGSLLVPVSRAECVGLRLLTNGLDAIMSCLNLTAQTLPDDARKRAAELRARGQISEPTALAASVRDMLAQSRGRTLSISENRVARQVLQAPQHRSRAGRWYSQIAGARRHLGSVEPTERHMIPGPRIREQYGATRD